MVYALVHYPLADTRQINQFRRKYDPQAGVLEPHITLMFPVPDSIGEGNLIKHLEAVLRCWERFPIHLQGFQKSQDDYLFLTVREGDADLVDLHRDIYTGLLRPYLREDVPFVPHLTLGAFSNSACDYSQALEEAKGLDLDLRCEFDSLHLVKLVDDRSQILWSKQLFLSM